jgi:hypothetical protein
MVALQIRDVPEDVRDILAERARAVGKSLQAFLLDLVQAEAARSRNIALLRQFEDRTDGTALSMEDIVTERDTARRDRHGGLDAPTENRPGSAA